VITKFERLIEILCLYYDDFKGFDNNFNFIKFVID